MAEMSKQTTVKVRYNKHEVYSVTVAESDYTPQITIMTQGSDDTNIMFADNADLWNFIGAMVKAAFDSKEHSYGNGYAYPNQKDGIITMEMLDEWRTAYENRPVGVESTGCA